MANLTFNPFLQDLPTYQPGRPIEEVARELGFSPGDIVKLASNENPLGPSPKALQAIQSTAATCHLYPDGNSFYLKADLAASLDVAPENLILGNGSNEIIEFVGHALLRPGTNAVLSEYSFAIYPIVTKMFGADIIEVPAVKYGHDLPAMVRAITPQTQVLFVANPNNPTGTLAPRKDVIELINAIPSHVLLVMDEAYIEFLSSPVDLIPLIRRGDFPNLLLMRTFSKIYGLAGLRIGYGIGHPSVISKLEKIRQPFNSNSLAQAGARAALQDTDHLNATRALNQHGLEFFEAAFRQMNLPFVTSHGNFIMIQVGDGVKVFQELQKRGIIARPLAGYRLPEWIRISIGTPQENQKCLVALKEVLSPKT